MTTRPGFLGLCLLFVLTACGETAPPPASRDQPGDTGATWSEAAAAGEATVRVLYVPAEGWAYTDPDGELTGVAVQIMQAFADWLATEHGTALNLAFVPEEDWSVFYGRVRDADGGVFGLGNVTITEQRRSELAFSPPYLTNVAVMISRDDRPALERPAQLEEVFSGLAGLAFAGTIHETRLRELQEAHWPGMGLDFAKSNGEIIDRVSGGEYFAYIDAYNYWRARQQGAPVMHHPVMDDPGEEFGIVMPVDSDWQKPLTAFFDDGKGLRNTPFYRSLLEQHLGEEVARLLLEQQNTDP